MRNSELHGYNPDLFNRDNCETGFLNQKFFPANYRQTPGGEQNESKPRPLIRAGVRLLTHTDLSTQSLEEWVRNERNNELWLEGHRFFDIRRWMIAPQTMSYGVRMGLNALQKKDPTFEEFNKPVLISQPFAWHNRMYASPVFENEIYKGPQFVQFPGY